MSTRKKGSVLLPALMVVLPIAAAGALGVSSRVPNDALVPVEYSVDYELRIKAYAPILREARQQLQKGSAEALLDVAQRWTDDHAEGRLSPLHPIDFGDDISRGVKAQIAEARSSLANRLLELGERQAARKHPSRACATALAVLKLADTTKDFDLVAAFRASCEQRRALILLDHLLPELQARDRLGVAEVLTGLRGTTAITHLAESEVAQFTEFRAMADGPALSAFDTECLNRLKDLVIGGACEPQEAQRWLQVVEDPELPGVIADIRSAAMSSRALDRRIDAILAQL